jgi:hypothetical protein
MKQKSTLLMVAILLLGAIFSVNSVAWSFERQIPNRIPEDQIVLQPYQGFEKSGTFCEIFNDVDSPTWVWFGFDSGMGFAVFMNPAECGPSPYPFEITDVHFYLYAPDETYHWPVAIRVNIRDSNQGDSCSGPQDVLCSEDFSVDSDSAFPDWMTLNLSNPCCVNQPFFLEIIYTEPRDPAHPHPSLIMDSDAYPADTCDNWGLGLKVPGIYDEWYDDIWTPPTPGDAIIRATGYTSGSHCDPEWYWKPDTTNAPSGMPDFDQYQDEWQAYCGPVAVANCLWWFDAVPKGWTPPQLIDTLARYFHCNPLWGTYVDTMQMGLAQYFIDYGFDLYERTYFQPNFYEMEDSLKRCQDIILLLGFYQWTGEFYDRIGGHFVTMAGVSSGSLKVALSDPARDMAVQLGWPGRIRPPEHPPEYPPTLHNDPTFVSQDMYTSTLESPSPGNPNWGLDYPYYLKGETPQFLGQNFQPEQEQFRGSYIPGVEVFTEVEWAVMICPGEWYWKPDTTHAPSGMPDFDQNQDEWESYCAPTAVANCLWWFDAVPKDMTPPELIELLAEYFKTDASGTDIDTLQKYLDQYFNDYGFALKETTYWAPDFHEMEESLKVCQDIILALGFYWYDGEQWWIEGGHCVTMAGVNSEGRKVALSDPDYDGAVMGTRPGRVRPPGHPPYPDYPPTLHNDTTYVSHDVYDCTLNPDNPSPGNPFWEIDDYYTPPMGDKHSGKNIPHRFKPYAKPAPKDKPVTWHTEVMAAIMICPKPTAVEGEEEGALTPKDFELYQNYPNPFNNETVIKFNLRKSAEVSLVVYNVLGQKVRTLVKARMDAGSQSVTWDTKDEKGNELSSGIYFYQLKSGEVKETKRLVLLK